MHDRRGCALLATGVLCASTSPPVIAATAAPALAIAFWRAVIAAVAFGQTPPAAAVPALALLLAGTALVISARERAPAEAP